MKLNHCYIGDCRDVMRGMAESSIDAIVTDPPYGLTNKSGGPHGVDNLYSRAKAGATSSGFMGMKWDAGVPGPEYWAEALRVAKPGAHLLAFGGTRTFHRLMVAIEDAGWDIRDTIMWVYGSGFPKSKNLGGAWEGWGTALKPSWEPIIVARKPLIGTVAANVLQHGTGGLNIDGCRVATDPAVDDHRLGGAGTWNTGKMAKNVYEGGYTGEVVGSSPLGRWPANLIHDGSGEVIALFPTEAGAAAPVTRRNGDKFRNTFGAFGGDIDEAGSTFKGDAGSAARFFYCAKASRADRNDGVGGSDTPAVSTGATMREREDAEWSRRNGNHHPTVKPTELMRYLCRLVTQKRGTILDPFCGSGSTGKAAVMDGFNFIGVDRDDEYVSIANARIAAAIPRQQGLEFGA